MWLTVLHPERKKHTFKQQKLILSALALVVG
jgi:hypothetical protein